MSAFDVLMTNQRHKRAPPVKKRWCTVSRHDTLARKRARARAPQPQRCLLAYIRPPSWIAEPLELDTDVVTTIAEVLMRSDDYWRKPRYLKTLALVNRVCAAAVASTLDRVRLRLQHNGQAHARAQRALVLHRRGAIGDGCEATEAALAEEAARLGAIHEAYMEEVGIPQGRRMTLVPFADRTWFHDNVSLLGHLGNACELCNGPAHIGTRDSGYSFRDGPVMLVACGRCKRKACVDLTLSYALRSKETVKVHIEQEETEANNYARALLSKQGAHEKRMRSKRATRMPPAKLGKRVHLRDMTNAMCMCYWNGTHRMSMGPWHIELWHALPKGLPQDKTFGALMGVRDSQEVRREARAHAMRLRARRARAAEQRIALLKLWSKYHDERYRVMCVVDAGTFAGWVQALDLCSAARAFEVRWAFRWRDDRLLPAWREQMYKLLDMDAAKRDAAVRRVACVAHVVRKIFDRTAMPFHAYHDKTPQRECALQLLRSFPATFLDRGVDEVYRVVAMVIHAGVELKLRSSVTGLETLVATYTLIGEPFDGRRMEVVGYFSDYTVRRIAEAMNLKNESLKMTPGLVRELQQLANLPLTSSYDADAPRELARAALFGMPAMWPSWLTA